LIALVISKSKPPTNFLLIHFLDFGPCATLYLKSGPCRGLQNVSSRTTFGPRATGCTPLA